MGGIYGKIALCAVFMKSVYTALPLLLRFAVKLWLCVPRYIILLAVGTALARLRSLTWAQRLYWLSCPARFFSSRSHFFLYVLLSLSSLFLFLLTHRVEMLPALHSPVHLPSHVVNKFLVNKMPSLSTPYSVPFLLKPHLPFGAGYLFSLGHVETIIASLFRPSLDLVYMREQVKMDDGGTVSLDTHDPLPAELRVNPSASTSCKYPPFSPTALCLPASAPILLLLPGLTGGSHDSYVQHAVISAGKTGFRAVVLNARGTSDSVVTSAQFYSASFTGDVRAVIQLLHQQYPLANGIYAAGWSLGANILGRYLGEEGGSDLDGAQHPQLLRGAILMGNPFHLPTCDQNFQQGFNRVYDYNMGQGLKRIFQKHAHHFEAANLTAVSSGQEARFDLQLAYGGTTIRHFDEAITRRSFGFASAQEYYEGSSSASLMHQVRVPTLVLQAADDPIALQAAIPFQQLTDNPQYAFFFFPFFLFCCHILLPLFSLSIITYSTYVNVDCHMLLKLSEIAHANSLSRSLSYTYALRNSCLLIVTPSGGHLGWCSDPQEGAFGRPWTDHVMSEFLAGLMVITRLPGSCNNSIDTNLFSTQL